LSSNLFHSNCENLFVSLSHYQWLNKELKNYRRAGWRPKKAIQQSGTSSAKKFWH